MAKLTALEYFNATVESAKNNRQEALDDFNEHNKDGQLLYALEWAQNQAVTVAQADMWLDVQRGAEHEAEEFGDEDLAVRVYSALSDAIGQATNALMRNYFRASSTDMFTNAVNGARAEAASRFVTQAERVIKKFDDEG